MFAQKQPNILEDNHFQLDKTKTKKIGDTTFVVSSFLRTDKAPGFLDIVGNLAKQDMQVKRPDKI